MLFHPFSVELGGLKEDDSFYLLFMEKSRWHCHGRENPPALTDTGYQRGSVGLGMVFKK